MTCLSGIHRVRVDAATQLDDGADDAARRGSSLGSALGSTGVERDITRNSGHEQISVAFPIRNSALVGQEEMIFVQDIIEGQEER
jgi:hypothetical protein